MTAKKIAVFDTNPEECEVTAAVIRTYYSRMEEEVDIYSYTETYPFACAFKKGLYDMVFLAMNSPKNLDTARKIGWEDPCCPLFFVSDTDDYGLEAHRLMALDYLLKPVTSESIARAVESVHTPFGRGRRREVS